MASLWELFVQISGDNSGFKQSVKDSGDSLMGFDKLASDVGGRVAGYLSVTALAGGILASAEAFDKAGVQIQRSTGATGQRLDGLTASMKSLYSGTAQYGAEVRRAHRVHEVPVLRHCAVTVRHRFGAIRSDHQDRATGQGPGISHEVLD